ncbi:MAG: CotH kinase family protein, partial [Planctomycetota bacterium]
HPDNWPYRDERGYYHTNFKLDSKGEYLALIAPDLQVAHDYGSPTGDADDGSFPALRADLSYGLHGDLEQFFAEPSPGQTNSAGFAEISDEPIFSHPAGTFTDYLLLELSSPNPAAEIRYTINGDAPGTSSTRYTGPIPLFGTREIVARAYEPGKAPSPAVSRTYVALDTDVLNFSSNLPIILVDTNRRSVGSGSFTKVHSAFIEPDPGDRAHIVDVPAFSGRGALKVRGSSTGGISKHQYAFEIWDENNQDRDVSLLGMPAESDWILYAPSQFDRALISNAFVFELSNQVGRYAVRTRFCEVYLNTNDDRISAGDYMGLYILMEKIKRGPQRVDIEQLQPWDDTEPAVSGGYMLKIDRRDPGDSGFRTARGNPTYGDGTLCYVDPKEDDITPAQSAWIRAHLDEFEDALYGPNAADPQTGYAKYIDVDSWVDHNLLNMLAMNVDALRLSTFFYKTRNGKLEMGPLWDFDRALDSTDGRDNNAQSWHGTGDGTDYHNYVWWNELFDDVNFWQKYIDRWYQLRRGAFSTQSIDATIDAMADEIREAEVRNTQRWTSYGPRFGGFQGEIDHLKDWLQTRCTWVDNQFAAPPQVSPDGVSAPSPGVVTLTNPNGRGTIYYTLDGSDPRVPVFAGAVLDSATIVPAGAPKRVLVPTAPVSNAWRGGTAFDDSAWLAGTGGVGYERSTGYEQFFDIDVQDQMYGRATSCLLRIPFALADDPAELNYMVLRIRYDDGFVAYLNGAEIARALFTGTPTWNAAASGSHSDIEAIRFEDFDVSAHAGLLQQGDNILAIHSLNTSSTSSDLLCDAELVAGQGSAPSGNGLSETALEYTGPITLGISTQIKARVFVGSNPYSPWSGLADPVVAVGPVAEDLRISEIMYHPA